MIKLTVTSHVGDTTTVPATAMDCRLGLLRAAKDGLYSSDEYDAVEAAILRVDESHVSETVGLTATDLAESCTIDISWVEEKETV